MSSDVLVFAAYGLAMQAALVAFFAVHRWLPHLSGPVGVAVYGLGALGIVVGWWLAVAGAGWPFVLGPVLTAQWAVFGAVVDLWRPRPWRGPPIIWPVLVPYVALYFVAQMFIWWPLWNAARTAWAVFLVLFVVSTALNIRGHVEAGRTPPA
jgi:hypothetical protein